MTEDLLERAQGLVDQTEATGELLAKRLDDIEARAKARRELDRRATELLKAERRRSRYRILELTGVAVAAMAGVYLASEGVGLKLLVLLAALLTVAVSFIALNHESLLQQVWSKGVTEPDLAARDREGGNRR